MLLIKTVIASAINRNCHFLCTVFPVTILILSVRRSLLNLLSCLHLFIVCRFWRTKNPGQLMLMSPLVIDREQARQNRQSRDADVFTLIIRAYDLGVPVMFSTINVRIYPPESKTRSVTFVLPGRNIDRKKTEDILSTITGGRVIIHDIQPYADDGSDDSTVGDNRNQKEMYVLESGAAICSLLNSDAI